LGSVGRLDCPLDELKIRRGSGFSHLPGELMSQLNVSEVSGVVCVSFNDTKILDEESIRQIGVEFAEAAKQAAGEKLLVKFDRVAFMSSAMIGQIMRLAKQTKADETELKLCGISADIMEVFKLTKLDKVLEIHPSETDAFAAFESPKKKGWFGH
jgi:anti-anti-sigma factor